MITGLFCTTNSMATVTDQAKRQLTVSVLTLGPYKHPNTKETAYVDADDLQKLMQAFRKMQANGVDVEIVHGSSDKAADVLGYVSDLYVLDDELHATLDLVGDDAITTLEGGPQIVAMIENFSDTTGTWYGPAITRIGTFKQDAAEGQLIAASLSGGQLCNVMHPQTSEQDRITASMIDTADEHLLRMSGGRQTPAALTGVQSEMITAAGGE